MNVLGDDVATVRENTERRLIGLAEDLDIPAPGDLPLQHNHGRPWRREGTSSTGKRT
ncbi:hypothetical protein [Nocardia cyriacigeorgica]|uniref:hypothetical protein n=1 Tax=Nocardia cyriacigeorgica TaxID=135487 RepID=UPI001319E859|nr:hypothetical protein [Nocardia cyriacigeorgica]